MSKLRTDLVFTSTPALYGGSAYFAVLNAVKAQPGLIAGQLRSNGKYCAIGSYFALPKHLALPNSLIDEVTGVNDSITGTHAHRKREMIRWLKWKLGTLGFPGYEHASKPSKR